MMLSSRRSPLRLNRSGPAAVLAFSLVLMAQASAAIDLTSVEKLTGQWDLSLNDTNRRCRLVLRADEVGPSLALALVVLIGLAGSGFAAARGLGRHSTGSALSVSW